MFGRIERKGKVRVFFLSLFLPRPFSVPLPSPSSLLLPSLSHFSSFSPFLFVSSQDASGQPLLDLFFYDPARDPDQTRAKELGGLMRPLRGSKYLFFSLSPTSHPSLGHTRNGTELTPSLLFASPFLRSFHSLKLNDKERLTSSNDLLRLGRRESRAWSLHEPFIYVPYLCIHPLSFCSRFLVPPSQPSRFRFCFLFVPVSPPFVLMCFLYLCISLFLLSFVPSFTSHGWENEKEKGKTTRARVVRESEERKTRSRKRLFVRALRFRVKGRVYTNCVRESSSKVE